MTGAEAAPAPARLSLGPNYRKLWASSAAANLADGLFVVALPLMAVSLTTSPVLVAGVSIAGRLPWLVFVLIAGALADRLDRRITMRNVQLMRVVVLGLSHGIGRPLNQVEQLASGSAVRRDNGTLYRSGRTEVRVVRHRRGGHHASHHLGGPHHTHHESSVRVPSPPEPRLPRAPSKPVQREVRTQMASMAAQQLGPMLTASEVAELLHLHVNTVKRLGDRGELPFYRVCKRGDRRFRLDDVLTFLAVNR